MVNTFAELTFGGVLVAPFVAYAGAAVVILVMMRPYLRFIAFDRAFISAPIAQLSLYILTLALLIALF